MMSTGISQQRVRELFLDPQVYLTHLQGDWMRNSRPQLEEVINAGVRPIFP